MALGRVVSFKSRPLYPPGNSLDYLFDLRLGEPQCQSGHCEENKCLSPAKNRTPAIQLVGTGTGTNFYMMYKSLRISRAAILEVLWEHYDENSDLWSLCNSVSIVTKLRARQLVGRFPCKGKNHSGFVISWYRKFISLGIWGQGIKLKLHLLARLRFHGSTPPSRIPFHRLMINYSQRNICLPYTSTINAMMTTGWSRYYSELLDC
jgi:hypothetical protein